MDLRFLFLTLLLLLGVFVDEGESWWTSRRRRRRCTASNCHVSGWSSWGSCSQNCGTSGVQGRSRRVTKVASCGGGCYHLSESRACNRKCCPVNCAWSWNNWGACQGCGTSTRTRTAAITKNPSCGGSACPGIRSQTQSCNTGRCCPVNCVTSNWGSWGACNAKCEKSGLRTRTRTVRIAASCNGVACPTLKQYNFCNGPCCKRDCTLTTWSLWGKCNAPSGSCSTNSGSHSRSRKVITKESCGGRCFPLQESNKCTPVPITCQVSIWGTWSTCTPNIGSCGAGKQSRTRTITRQPYCSAKCPATSETRSCVHSCCPVNCVLSTWTTWGKCSANCGSGLQQRTRRITTPASCKGTCSSNLAETKKCTVINKIDCQMNTWSTWSVCSSGCGTGSQQRKRTIKVQPTVCGVPCGKLTDTKVCTSYRENRNCQVSSWQKWGSCDNKCGIGMKTRSRTITVSQRCRGSICPSLKGTASCGVINGGCQQTCQKSDGACGCIRGYEPTNKTHCQLKDCGQPRVDYCPTGPDWAKGDGVGGTEERIGIVASKEDCYARCSVRRKNGKFANGATVDTKTEKNCYCEYGMTGRDYSAQKWTSTFIRGAAWAKGDGVGGTEERIGIVASKEDCYAICNVRRKNGKLANGATVDTKTEKNCYCEYGMTARDYSAQKWTSTLIFRGVPKGTVCVNPWIRCASGKTTFGTSCTLSCPTTHMLKGTAVISCDANARWFPAFATTYCKRINEPPTDIILSGNKRVKENSPRKTFVGSFSSSDPNAMDNHTYTLIPGAASLGKFEILGNSLYTMVSLDYETGPKSYTIGVKSTDNGNPPLSTTKSFTISIDDVNERPTNIVVSSLEVAENSDLGTIVGVFDTVDVDAGQSNTYKLVNNSDNIFSINNNKLQVAVTNGDCLRSGSNRCPLNYEKQKSYSIRVMSSDDRSPSFSITRDFNIKLTDKNDPPFNTRLIGNTVKETSPYGTVVGIVTAMDEDVPKQSFTYSLLDDDNGRFAVYRNGTVYKTKATDYETDKSHHIQVQVTDNGVPPASNVQNFTIIVLDVNEPPVNITISSAGANETFPDDQPVVSENVAVGTVVGAIESFDRDYISALNLTLDDDAGGRFKIDDKQNCGHVLNHRHSKTICRNDLLVNGKLDFEQSSSHVVIIRAGDRGHFVHRLFMVGIKDRNDPAHGLLIDGKTSVNVKENLKGAIIGRLQVLDEDKNQSHSIKLSDDHNGTFVLNKNVLGLASTVALNYESKQSYNIDFDIVDDGTPPKSVSMGITVRVTNVNEAPTDMRISANSVFENVPEGTMIANISVTDPDDAMVTNPKKYHVCTLTDSANGRFKVISNLKLVVGPGKLDYEADTSHSVTIQCSDGALSFTKAFTISVKDVNERPISVQITNNKLQENQPGRVLIGYLSTTDPDNQAVVKQTFKYSIPKNETSFEVIGNGLYSTRSFDFEVTSFVDLTVVSEDNGSPPLKKFQLLRIEITDGNDAPTDIVISGTRVDENSMMGTTIGTLVTVDEDTTQTFVYQMVDGADGRFKIEKNIVKVASSNTECLKLGGSRCMLNYEKRKYHVIQVKSTDSGSPAKSFTKNFTIQLSDVNDRPRDVVLSNYTVAENAPINFVIGRFSFADEDEGQKFTFMLSQNDSGRFGVDDSGNLYKASNETNYETDKSHRITVVVTDNGNPPLNISANFVIEVLDVNEAPIKTIITSKGGQLNFTDDNPRINENSAIGTVIGSIVSYDSEAVENIKFKLDDNAGGIFKLGDDVMCKNTTITSARSMCSVSLVLNSVVNYETQSSHWIIVRSTDKEGLFHTERFLVNVVDQNDAPTGILIGGLKYAIVPENQAGTLIDRLKTIDEDSGQSHVYESAGNNSEMYKTYSQYVFLSRGTVFDYEAQTKHFMTIKSIDSGRPPMSFTETLELRVEDVNEVPTGVTLSNSIVSENSIQGTVVGNLTVSDPDNLGKMGKRQTHKCSITSGSSLLLKVQGMQLIVAHGGIDFEKTDSYNISIRCEDSGRPTKFIDEWFGITVRDLNEKPTSISISSDAIPENSPIGTGIGVLSTTDPDNFQVSDMQKYQTQTFTYTILNNETNMPFKIGKDSVLRTTRELNYERQKSWTIKLRSSDSGTPAMFVDGEIVINVTDVNEQPSDVSMSNTQIPENSGLGSLVGTLMTSDPDSGQSFTYSLSDNAGGRFRIISNRLEVALSNNSCLARGGDSCLLNYEQSKIQTIMVRSQDNGLPPLSFEKEFTINLTDVNDRPRDLSLSSNRVPENATRGYLIGQLSATDEDAGQKLSFQLIDDDNGSFALNKDAFITKAKDTDYENQKVHKISVQVSDNGSPVLKLSKDFVIIIEDVNEAPATIEITSEQGQLAFSKNSPRVNENSPPGTIVGTLFAYDEDLVERLTFTLDDNAKGRFSLDATTPCSNSSKTSFAKQQTICKVLLKVAGAIDYEVRKSLTIIVRATDSNGMYHSQPFKIAVVDQNDRPTDITLNGGYVGFVNENENNALIATLETTDEDNAQAHSYRIIQDSSMTFIITGSKLYTSPHASLNYELKKKHIVLIESTDNGSPSLSIRKNLTVQVMDVNEAPTLLRMSNNNVKENSPIGTLISNITVTDPDNEGSYSGRQRASCSITYDASGIFAIKDFTKFVTRRDKLDYESTSSYAINIRCKDNGVPSKSLAQTFTIIVDDVNEAPTSITLTDRTVPENQNNALVGKLVVSDPDRTKQTFVLTIEDSSLPFMIVEGSSLKTNRPLNFEQKNEYRVSVKAVDQGGLSIIQNFTIQVIDKNDPPSSIMFLGLLSIEESASAGSLVATASALDEDIRQTHEYAILSVIGSGQGKTRNVKGLFAIDTSSGRITSSTSSIDYEEFTFFNISVVATDNGVPKLNTTGIATIKVNDVNHPPTDILLNGSNVVENSPVGTLVGNITVVDPDNKYSMRQTFTCVLDRTGGSLPFKLSEKSLVVSGVVDFEQKQLFSVQITCTENHVNPFNITRNFVINVLNVNEAPTGIKLSSNTIPENQNSGGLIGTVVAVDPDNELTHVDNITITLLPGLDSAAFRLVVGNSLVANQSFDYEQKNKYSVKLRATDSASSPLSSEKIVDIKVLDMNDPPTDISLSASAVSENAKKDEVIGMFSTMDQDKAQKHTFTFINTVDNLGINGNKLLVSGKLDFETEPTIFINVKVTDNGSPAMSFQKSFNVTVTDANDAPSAISVTSYPVFENNTLDKMVASVAVIDEDGGQTHTCSVLNNPGYFYFKADSKSDNSTLFIKGTASLDFETRPVINVTIQCSDNGVPPLPVQTQISIKILDSNERPTKVLINGSDVVNLPENSPIETVVGQFSCKDQDADQSYVYSLQNTNGVFKIDADLLLVNNNSVLDYETLPGNKRIPISVKVTDSGRPSLSLTSTLQVQVTDVNEAPSNVRMIYPIADRIPENTTIGTHIGELFCDNPEGFRQLITYELLNWKDVFSITEGHGPGKVSYLTIKKELDYAIQDGYNLTVRATDNGKPSLSAQAVISIAVERSDPCYTGEIKCGGEVCQRVNKTRGNCGCIKGYELKDNACVEINECESSCKLCDDPTRACLMQKSCPACFNNATCTDKLLGYHCSCPVGFTDDRCGTNIDDCLAKPCQFGTCFDLVNGYRCECDNGYTGQNCSINIDDCLEKPCVMGRCKDLVAAFSCTCEEGVSGVLCDRKATDCDPNPCGQRKCVPPSHKDKNNANGNSEPVCAGEEHIVRLTFSNVTTDSDKLGKWKLLLRRFIITRVGIPYYSVDLSEDLSNGGVYYPTDVIMYPIERKSKVRREVNAGNSDSLLQLISKVQDNLVTEKSFLIAMNISCSKIVPPSDYWVYCSAVFSRIADLGLTGGSEKKPSIDRATGPAPFLTTNNIYIIAGSAGGFILLVAVVLIVRARQRRVNEHRPSLGGAPLVAGDSTYYDAMERHLAKRVEDSYMESVTNPMYGADEPEVEHDRKMFANPLFGNTAGIYDDEPDNTIDDADMDDHGGIVNPMYGHIAKLNGRSGDTDC